MTEEKLTNRMQNMERTQEEIIEILRSTKKKKWGPKTKWMLGRAKLKKGYIKILEIGENKEFNFRKEPIVESTILLDDSVHVVTAEEIHTHKGKPAVIQYKNKLVAFDPTKKVPEGQDSMKINGENQTYGQKYVMNRMSNEAIKPKKGMGGFGWIILIFAIIGGVIYYYSKSGGPV